MPMYSINATSKKVFKVFVEAKNEDMAKYMVESYAQDPGLSPMSWELKNQGVKRIRLDFSDTTFDNPHDECFHWIKEED